MGGAVELWDAATGKKLAPTLLADTAEVTDVASFTWPTSPAAWEHGACSVAGRNLTRAEWRELVGGSRYTTVCP